MLPEPLRLRLEALRAQPPARAARAVDPPMTIALDALPGAVEVETPSGTHLSVRSNLAQWRLARPDPRASRVLAPRASLPALRSAADAGPTASSARIASSARSAADHAAFTAAYPRAVVCLDLETCGFSGSAIFLIGLIHQHDGEWIVEQLLARHYGEEAAILDSLWRILADKRVLVTFNGKSFDWPMVQDRTVRHRLSHSAESAAPETHFDLLHHSRRAWGRQLPDCRLQTLERLICGRTRHGDLPGRDVPLAYHRYVRDGDARPMRSILHHNAWDLATLFELAQRLALPAAEAA